MKSKPNQPPDDDSPFTAAPCSPLVGAPYIKGLEVLYRKHGGTEEFSEKLAWDFHCGLVLTLHPDLDDKLIRAMWEGRLNVTIAENTSLTRE